ncbi:MAG: hypothetical protein ABII12_13980 [Planctomycetota bacterium]
MKTKTFDCIQMKRATQKKIRAAVAGLDRKAEIEFFRAGAKEFEQRIQAAKESLTRTEESDGR